MMKPNVRTAVAVCAALFAGALVWPAAAAAHCDSMDGPVVKAAQHALETGNVNLVLVWVRAQDEPEIRSAFARVLEVRRLGPEARGLADSWFFETLVRVHRAGEGAPYTGLKPAGQEPVTGIAAADRALEAGTVEALAHQLAEHAATAVRERFARVQAASGYDPADVAAGRAYVHAYVEYIHFVENVHGLIHGGGGDMHAAPGAGRDGHH